ncbi:unnamed protein product, partial [Scytosiphon promiscuus]
LTTFETDRLIGRLSDRVYAGAIYSEVMNRGTYSHTAEELVHGARVCWRNSAK